MGWGEKSAELDLCGLCALFVLLLFAAGYELNKNNKPRAGAAD
jgi:hypothetical protein